MATLPMHLVKEHDSICRLCRNHPGICYHAFLRNRVV